MRLRTCRLCERRMPAKKLRHRICSGDEQPECSRIFWQRERVQASELGRAIASQLEEAYCRHIDAALFTGEDDE